MIEAITQLHLLRPQWLWALLLLPLLAALWVRRTRRRNVWRTAVDPHLLPHLLAGADRRRLGGLGVLLTGVALAIAALSGPSWRQLEQPLWQPNVPLVVVLDLSHSITASDLQPSRLLQARSKIDVLLRKRQGGDMALVVYAGEAFTVAPLTADAANLRLFLDELGPQIMPVPGQRADRGIALAVELLHQSGAGRGQILLMSGQVDASAVTAAGRAMAAGFRVSALGLGTVAGAAYRDATGMVVRTFLDEASLRALATAGGGRYQALSVDDADLTALGVLSPQQEAGDQVVRSDSSRAVWQDEGYWLLLPLMVLALLAFRRRGAMMMLALMCVAPWSFPSHAAEPGGLWRRADQLQHQRLAEGVQAYRDKDYARAQRQFEGIDTSEGWYNLGNALARQGQYDDAIKAYERALGHQPGMPDAVANKAAVEAARQRQSPQSRPAESTPDQPSTAPRDGSSTGQSGSDSAAGEDAPGKPSSSSQQPQPARQPQQGQSNQRGKGSDATAPDDPQAQQQADQAQREQMARAMQQGKASGDPRGESASQMAPSAQERERQQAIEAWMQRVPDDPGSILKAKFQLEHERRRREGR